MYVTFLGVVKRCPERCTSLLATQRTSTIRHLLHMSHTLASLTCCPVQIFVLCIGSVALLKCPRTWSRSPYSQLLANDTSIHTICITCALLYYLHLVPVRSSYIVVVRPVQSHPSFLHLARLRPCLKRVRLSRGRGAPDGRMRQAARGVPREESEFLVAPSSDSPLAVLLLFLLLLLRPRPASSAPPPVPLTRHVYTQFLL